MRLPKIGETIDHFKILKSVGKGGMGQVFLAEDTRLHRKVALKFLGSDKKKLDPKILFRFQNEARILASLNHPNIVNIYTLGDYLSVKFLAMEYVEGVTLAHVIEKKSYGLADSLKAIKQVLQGLSEAHNKGILHRDIKPANLLVGKGTQVKIVDFGISKNLVGDDPKITKENHFIGTINYMAPEVLRGQSPSPASDIFSVGVVFFELITGKNPFPSENKFETIEKIRNEQVVIPQELKKNMPYDLIVAIEKLLCKDKNQRYQSAKEALDDLENIEEADLPDFHGISLRPDLVIINREEVRLKLVRKGYHEHEIDIIFKLAVKLEELKRTVLSLEEHSDQTLDLVDTDETGQIRISPENLELAIENYEKSKTKNMKKHSTTQHFTSQKPMISTSLSEISFPLFKPKFILRSLVVFGLLYVNYGIYSYLVDSKNEKIVKQKIAFIKRLFNNKEITDIIPLNEAINVGKRALSSVPSGSLKLFPVGTTVKTKIKRFNSDTGEIVFNHTNTLKIRKWTENNMMYAHLYNGKTKTWSSQQLNGNPFLPPARWYRKKGFNFKNIVTEESEKFYPINKGRKIGFKFRTISRGGLTAENIRDCEVKDIAEVVILGVKQKLFQTECVTRKNQTTEMATYFYSSQYDYILKSKIIINSPEGKFEENSEVISLDIPKL